MLEAAEKPFERILLLTEDEDKEWALLFEAFGLEGLMQGPPLRQAIAKMVEEILQLQWVHQARLMLRRVAQKRTSLDFNLVGDGLEREILRPRTAIDGCAALGTRLQMGVSRAAEVVVAQHDRDHGALAGLLAR